MRIIVISGNTGTGKTTLLNIMGAKGHGVINSDKITQMILKGCTNVQDIKQKFFTDPEFRASHEKWIRPKIYRRIVKEILYLFLQGCSTIFIEVPLLFELGLNPYFYTIVVACDEDLQMKRARSLDYLNERLALQLPIEEKIRLAQLVIYNNGDIDELERSIDRFDFSGCSIYSCLAISLAIIMLTMIPE